MTAPLIQLHDQDYNASWWPLRAAADGSAVGGVGRDVVARGAVPSTGRSCHSRSPVSMAEAAWLHWVAVSSRRW